MKLEMTQYARKRELIAIVKEGQKTFMAVGLALLEIRDSKLYVEEGTFEQFCEKHFGFGRAYAYRLIDGVKATEALPKRLSTKVDTLPAATAVAKVPQEQREQVVSTAAAAGPVTAASVQQAAAKIHDAELVLTDATELARTVPTEIADDWKRAESTAKDILHKLRDVLHAIDEGLKAEDIIFADTTNGELSPLKAVIGHVNLHVKPHAVCAICHGLKSRKSCKLCKGRGYIGRHLWQTCVDIDTKALIAKMGGAK